MFGFEANYFIEEIFSGGMSISTGLFDSNIQQHTSMKTDESIPDQFPPISAFIYRELVCAPIEMLMNEWNVSSRAIVKL